MSTLQISLAVLGVLLLGLIVAYNSWTHRRNAPRRPEGEVRVGEDASRFDPALDGVDVTNLPPAFTAVSEPLVAEPMLGEAAAVHEVAGSAVPDAQPVEPHVAQDAEPGMPAAAATAPRASVAPADRKPQLDPLIDAIAPMRLDHAITGDAALLVQPTTRRAGSKPFRIEGMNEATREWEMVRAGQRYTAFQAGVQLANRLGALNEIEFSEFVAKVQTFADAINAVVELPDMIQEVGRARELDQFANECDAQLSFSLRPLRAAWSPGYIEQQAAMVGFVTGSMPGRMHLPSLTPGHAPLLQLHYDAQAATADKLDQTAVYEVGVSLDVPQVPREEAPFARLREVLQTLCVHMDGAVCDPNGAQIPEQMLDLIASDLDKLYDRLDSRELSAGSMLARRLFN